MLGSVRVKQMRKSRHIACTVKGEAYLDMQLPFVRQCSFVCDIVITMVSNGSLLNGVQKVSGVEGAQLQLVRATPEEAKQHEEEERQARLQSIHNSAGTLCSVDPAQLGKTVCLMLRNPHVAMLSKVCLSCSSVYYLALHPA